MKGALQLFGTLSILAGFGLALFEMVNAPFGSEPNWVLAASYFLAGLLGGLMPLGLAEALHRLEVIQSHVARPADKTGRVQRSKDATG